MKLRLILTAAAMIMTANFTMAVNKPDFLPLPKSVEYSEGSFVMDKRMKVSTEGADSFNAAYLRRHLDRIFDFKVDAAAKGEEGSIRFASDPSMGAEDYSLVISSDGIVITSSSKAGEFYAVQTLFQMMPAEIYADLEGPGRMMLKSWELPCVTIVDSPRFSYRGSMLDVSRTFFDKDYVKRHIDYLAYHKINSFHWHLADDNGWRIEIKKYPLLTEKGAWRGYGEVLPPSFNSGNERYGGFYTQKEIKEIVTYAAERNITIIPEIDLPGHSKALAASYPEVLCETDNDLVSVQGENRNVVCVGSENTYRFLENIIKEVAPLFPGEYFHIGGDEVQMKAWALCPHCKEVMKRESMESERQLLGYFAKRMEKILAKYGKKLAGWDEINDEQSLDSTCHVYAWRGRKSAIKAASEHRYAVLQVGEFCYLDMKYTEAERGHNWAGLVPMEKIYSFDPVGTLEIPEDQRKYVLGPQAGLWTEMLIFPPHFSEYQMFPRLCALSEIGWSEQSQREYVDFDNRLTRSHFERLYNMGIKFRLPYPELKMEGDKVFASVAQPSLVIRYTFDGSEPSMSSPVYTSPIVTDSPEKLRFATFYANLKSVTVKLPGFENYLKPEVKVTSSMESTSSTSCESVSDYDFSTYFRSAKAPSQGDWMLFEFKEPVVCNTIDVNTNIPVIEFWGISDGHVEYTCDGENYINAGIFDIHNTVRISNIIEPVKAVKIVVDGPCEFKQIAIQDLKIQ